MRNPVVPALLVLALAALVQMGASAQVSDKGLRALPPVAAEESQTFADVSPGHPYYAEIEWLYQNGYTAGCSTNPLMYCPDATMNRAESAVFVERGIHHASYEPPAPPSQVFADVGPDSWAAKWVNGLWQDQYTTGCGTNPLVYCPWQGHTRAEGAVFYLRMLHGASYQPSEPMQQMFADVPLDAWYAKWAEAAYEAELITACETSPSLRFCPEAPLTRGVAAYMMVRAKSAPGRTYYVSPSGNDANPGTEAQPWRTIQKAADTMMAGDTVYIRGGTYSEQVIPQHSGGVSGGYITYAAYPGETPIIDGKDLSLATWDGLFHIKGSYVGSAYVRRSYIRVSGLRVINAKGGADSYGGNDVHGIRVDNSDYIIIKGNSTYNTRSSGIGVWNSTHVVIDGDDIALACNLGGPDNLPGAEENLTVDGSSYIEVRNNHVHDGATFPNGWSGGEGINVKNGSHHIRIFNNIVHLKPVDGSPPNRLAFGIDAWDSTTSTHDVEIFGNVAYDSFYGFIVSSEQGGTVENVRVYNNIAYNNTGDGFSIVWWSGTKDGLKKNIQFFNNTSYNNRVGFSNQSPLNENVVVRNNLFSQNATNMSIVSAALAQTTVDHNLFFGPGNTYGSDVVVGDPRLVDPAGGDLHLQEGSAAIDVGSPLDAPYADFDGITRPQEAGFDIGAFEYVAQRD
jgi:hypothetical protein